MRPLVTLINLSCAKACLHCSYGERAGTSFATLFEITDSLMAAGHPVHFYDMHVTRRSIELFRRTRQFERPNPGWLNVNADFDPSDDDVAYLNTLQTALVISLHGASAESHARLAGDARDFDAIVAAFERLRPKIRLPLGINYVVHRHNIAEIPAFLELALYRLRVRFVEFINLGYGGTATHALDASMALDAASFGEAYRTLREARRRYRDFIRFDSQWGPDFAGFAPTHCELFAEPVASHYCNAGINHLALRADNLGVWPCPTLTTLPSLRIGRYEDGRIVLDAERVENVDAAGAPCASCEHRARCHGGPRCIAIGEGHRATGEVDAHVGFDLCLHQSTRRERLRLAPEPRA